MALDNIDELNVKNASPFPTALRYGLIGGLINITLGIVMYLSDMNPWVTTGLGLLTFVINIALIVMAIRAHRDKELGGYITLGRCIGIGVIVTILTAVMSLLWTVILYQFIDPDMPERIAEMTIEMLEGFGVPDEQIDETRDRVLESSSLGTQIKNTLLWTPITGAIISLIVGLIMKKSRPVEV